MFYTIQFNKKYVDFESCAHIQHIISQVDFLSHLANYKFFSGHDACEYAAICILTAWRAFVGALLCAPGRKDGLVGRALNGAVTLGINAVTVGLCAVLRTELPVVHLFAICLHTSEAFHEACFVEWELFLLAVRCREGCG
jgi:hypothetical protein